MDPELGALAEGAAGFDLASMGLDYAIGEGKAKAGAFLAGGEEGPKDFGKRVGRNAFAVVFDADDGVIVFAGERDIDRALAGDGLDSIENEIQDDLLDERRIVGHGGKGRIRRKENFDGTRANLLLRQHHGLLDRDVQVGGVEGGRPRTRIGEQIVQDVLDVEDFILDVSEHGSAGAIGGKFLAHHINDAGDAREGIANFVGEAGGQFAKGGKVFGATHFATVEFLDFVAVALELLDHFVELTAELANVVAPLGKGDTGR